MNKNPMRPILNIRTIREDEASREYRRHMGLVSDAKDRLQARIREAEEFVVALTRKEAEFSETLVREALSMVAVKALRRELESWRFRLTELLALVEEERKNVAKAEELCAKARAQFMIKSKDKMKIEGFSDRWQAQANKEAEAREEVELEDRIFKGNSSQAGIEVEST